MGNETGEESSESRASDLATDRKDEQKGSSGGSAAWMRALREVAPYLDLGWRLAGTTAFPPLIGYGLDLWVGTPPWFLLTGCVFGLGGAVVLLKRLQAEFR